MSLKLKDAEIKSILAEVKSSLQAAKKAELAKLAKAVDGEESSPAGAESAAESTPVPPEGASSEPASSPEMPPESAPASSGPVDESMSAPPESAPAEDPGMDASADPAALCAEYAKLDDASLKSHYMACKQAVFERMQGAPSADPAASAPPAPAAPPAPGMDAMKGEKSGMAPNGNIDPVTKDEAGTAKDGNVDPVTPATNQNLDGPAAAKDGPGADLSHKQTPENPANATGAPKAEVAKSEKSVEVKELEAQIEGLAKAVTLLMNPPTTIRKAVTSVAMMDRAEGLNKSEKTEKKALSPADTKNKLSDLIRSGKLSKAEKQAVVDYTLTKNQVHLEKIAHLFE